MYNAHYRIYITVENTIFLAQYEHFKSFLRGKWCTVYCNLSMPCEESWHMRVPLLQSGLGRHPSPIKGFSCFFVIRSSLPLLPLVWQPPFPDNSSRALCPCRLVFIFWNGIYVVYSFFVCIFSSSVLTLRLIYVFAGINGSFLFITK